MQTPRSNRTTELVKEFARQGHDVTVYSVLGNYDYSDFLKEFPLITLKNIPLKWNWHPYNSDSDGKRYLIDKILGKLLEKRFLFPNIEFYYVVQKILKNDNIYDAIISIAEPHQIHWGIAAYRRKKPQFFPKIWIADCGDPFINNNKETIKYRRYGKYEHLFCEECDYITVPEPEAINGYFNEFRNKVKIIPQGFDFDDTKNKNEINNQIPTFAYAGTFYEGIRNPYLFMKLLCQLDLPFKFVVYSNYPKLILDFKEKLGEKLEIREGIPRKDLLLKLGKMNFLINFNNVNSPNQIPSKLIDYAISNRPILNIDPLNPDKENLISFLKSNYEKQYIVKNLSQYKIQNVYKSFFYLLDSKN